MVIPRVGVDPFLKEKPETEPEVFGKPLKI